MGEAKRKKAERARLALSRSWAAGSITIVANDVECFNWSGTRQDAVDLEKRFLAATGALGVPSHSYAVRAAGYLMAYGMPRPGDIDQRPSTYGATWQHNEIEAYKAAVLWLALREHVPDTGQKVEDVFVGKALEVIFTGDKDSLIEESRRELRGEPFSEEEFTMMVGVRSYDYRLDPEQAVGILGADLFAMTGTPLPPDTDSKIGRDTIYVPRIPVDAAEADAMLKMITIFVDAATPTDPPRTYAGYTDQELSRGRPGLRIR